MAARKVTRDSSFTAYVNLFPDGNDSASSGEGNVEETTHHAPELSASQRTEQEWVVVPDEEIQESGTVSSTPTSPVDDEKADDKLCGYLNKYKLGARGIKGLANFKRRWFVYASNCCKLLYYRTPEDMVPLGEIDVAHASFSFDVENSLTTFEVRSQGRIYLLEAPNKTTMLYWLQELQKKRRNYSQRKTKLTRKNKEQDTVSIKKGLISSDSRCVTSSGEHVPDLLEPIECPESTVGQRSALSRKGSRFRRGSDLSTASWKNELRQIMSNLKPGRSRSYTDAPEQPDQNTTHTTHTPTSGSVFYNTINDDNGTENVPNELPSQPDSQPVVHRRSGGIPFPKLSNLKNKLMKSKSSDTEHVPYPECQRCKIFEETIANQKEETNLLEEELQATREIVRVLQKHVDKLSADIKSRLEMKDDTRQYEYDMVKQRDSKIVDLEHFIAIIRKKKKVPTATLR